MRDGADMAEIVAELADATLLTGLEVAGMRATVDGSTGGVESAMLPEEAESPELGREPVELGIDFWIGDEDEASNRPVKLGMETDIDVMMLEPEEDNCSADDDGVSTWDEEIGVFGLKA